MSKRVRDADDAAALPWSALGRKPKARRSSGIHSYLVAQSGDDIDSMLRDVLSVDELQGLAVEAYTALRNMATPYMALPPKDRFAWVDALRSAGFSQSQCTDLGYQVSWNLWASSSTAGERDKGGRPPLDEAVVDELEKFLISRSHVIPGRFIVNSESLDNPIPVRRVDATWTELFNECKLDISWGSFLTLKPKYFVQSTKPSDMCPFCEGKKAAIRALDRLKKQFKCPKSATAAFLRKKFAKQPMHKIMVALDMIDEATKHRYFHVNQHGTYLDDTDDPAAGVLVIDIDWKEKFTLPLGPVNTSDDTYAQTEVAILGVGFYWMESGERRTEHVDLVSRTITENAHTSIEGLLTAIREMEGKGKFHMCDFSSVKVWADAGKHFRCAEFVGFVLGDFSVGSKSLSTLYKLDHIAINYLVEKHGKNWRDTHFSSLRRYINRIARKKYILTASDLKNALEAGYKQVCSEYEDVERNVTVYLLNMRESGTYDKNLLRFEHIDAHYCIRKADGKYTAAYLSGDDNGIGMEASDTSTKVPYQLKRSTPKPTREPSELAATLRKRRLIREALFGVRQ